MTRNSRELSQLASFVDVRDANQHIGITTTLVVSGGVGIGSTVGDYLEELIRIPDAEDPLVVFSETHLVNDIFIEESRMDFDAGDTASITSAGSTFNKLNVRGLTTSRHLTVSGVTTLGTNFTDAAGVQDDIGIVVINEGNATRIEVGGAGTGGGGLGPSQIGFALTGPGGASYLDDDDTTNAVVVIDSREYELVDDQLIALHVLGKAQFDGFISTVGSAETSFVVIPQALFYSKITGVSGLDIINHTQSLSGTDDAKLRVINNFLSASLNINDDSNISKGTIFTDGGATIEQNLKVGYAVSIGEKLILGRRLGTEQEDHNQDKAENEIFNDTTIYSPKISIIGNSTDSPYSSGGITTISLGSVKIDGDLIPTDEPKLIGNSTERWTQVHVSDQILVGDNSGQGFIRSKFLDVGTYATVAKLRIPGIGETDTNAIYLEVTGGKTLVDNFEADGEIILTGITTISGGLNVITNDGGPFNGYINTSFQANNVDVYKQDETNSTNPEFFYPAMANAGISQTAAGARLFVNQGFYLDAFSTSLFVSNNLNVLGTSINANQSELDLRFDLLNYGVTELNLASQARYIDIGEPQSTDGGITSIRSNVTELTRLRLSQNDIQASSGTTAVRFTDVDTKFFGKVTIGGTEIFVEQNDFKIGSSVVNGSLYESATNVLIGDSEIGFTTIRNNATHIDGFLRLGQNVIQADDDATSITVGSAGTFVELSGDLILSSDVNIKPGFGETDITLSPTKTIFYKDIEIRGNNILASDGTVNITLFDNQELTSVTGALRIEGDQIRAGTGDTNITLSGNQSTIFAGAIEIDGDEIRASNGQANILLDSDVLTEFRGDIQVGGAGTIKAPDGIVALTVKNGTGNVAITSDVSANSAFFNGLEARLNVQDVNIRDNIVELGLIEDPTTEGTLIPPNVGLGNSGDVGFLMARYDIGLSTHKYAGIFYDESAGRIAIRTDVEDAGGGEVGRDRKLQLNGLPSELEVKNLLVTLNNTIGVKTLFEPSSSDATVLTLGNVEVDAGTY